MQKEKEVRFTSNLVDNPLDLVRLSLHKRVEVKMRRDIILRGELHGFDAHLNIVLGKVVETQFIYETEEKDKLIEKRTREIPMLFVRGDGIVHISCEVDMI